MVVLEKNGLLEKLYLSAARIPTTKAYKYYDSNIINKDIDVSILDRIRKVINQRNISIDQIINESVQIIKEIVSLPILVTKIVDNDVLKKIDLIQLAENKAILIIVSGSGNISKSEITLSNDNIEDLIVCIKILNERLIETPIKEIVDKIDIIVKIISKEIKMNELLIQGILLNMFQKITKDNDDLKNSKHLIYKKEIFDIEKFQKVIKILEDNSI
jgi:heat-inducible transcriptional repressor